MCADIVRSLCPNFFFHIHEKYFPCEFNRIDLQSCYSNPIYYYHNKGEKYITYVLFYKFDGGIHGFGSHKIDVEFVRVFYNDKSEPIRYFLSEHSKDQGMYVDVSKVMLDENKRPTFFVALNTHAHYPSNGVWVRCFCFANDVCGRYKHWDPSENIIQIEDPEHIRTKFGDGHMQWFAETSKLVGQPKRWGFIYRFLYPLSNMIRVRYCDRI